MERSRVLSAAISWDREKRRMGHRWAHIVFLFLVTTHVWIVSIAIIIFWFAFSILLDCHGFGKDGGDTPIPYSDVSVSVLLRGQDVTTTDQHNYLLPPSFCAFQCCVLVHRDMP